jgi:hypothetical protein
MPWLLSRVRTIESGAHAARAPSLPQKLRRRPTYGKSCREMRA